MTDDKLDQILKQALSPDIDDSEILIRRKKNKMKKSKIITIGLVACAAVALAVTGISFSGGGTSGTGTRNLFVITANAAELPEGISSGEVIGISTIEAGHGSSAFLSERFFVSGENIDTIKITTDKCNLYYAVPISMDDSEFADANKAIENGNADEYVMIAEICSSGYEEPPEYKYEKLTVVGPSYEGSYNSEMSFGMSVPEELWSSDYDLQAAYHADVDQVNDATLTIEATFTDGSTETHHYKLSVGKIYVPSDENGYLQWDKLTRFVTDGDVGYKYGYLMTMID